jgi:hypothetical protein
LPKNTGIRWGQGTGYFKPAGMNFLNAQMQISEGIHTPSLKRIPIWTEDTSSTETIASKDRHHGFKPHLHFSHYIAAHKMGSEMHEPDAVKVARPVLGRGRDGNIPSLFDGYVYADDTGEK